MWMKFSKLWAACGLLVAGWCWLLCGCFKGACCFFREVFAYQDSVGGFFLVMKIPRIFSFRRAISLLSGTRKRCPDRPTAVQGCWPLICVLRLSPRDLEVPLVFHLLPVSEKLLREHRLVKSDVCCCICSSGCRILYWSLRLWFGEGWKALRHSLLLILQPWLSFIWLLLVTAPLNWSKKYVQSF